MLWCCLSLLDRCCYIMFFKLWWESTSWFDDCRFNPTEIYDNERTVNILKVIAWSEPRIPGPGRLNQILVGPICGAATTSLQLCKNINPSVLICPSRTWSKPWFGGHPRAQRYTGKQVWWQFNDKLLWITHMLCAGQQIDSWNLSAPERGAVWGSNVTSGDGCHGNDSIFLVGFIHCYYDYLGLMLFMCA